MYLSKTNSIIKVELYPEKGKCKNSGSTHAAQLISRSQLCEEPVDINVNRMMR